MASGAAAGTWVFNKQLAVKACEDREFSVFWDSNAESVRRQGRRTVRLKNSRSLLSSPQKKSWEKGRENRKGDTGWTWRRDEQELQDEDDYEIEYDDDDEEGLDWRMALGIIGFGLPAAVLGIPWLIGNPMTFTMLLALAPLVQRAYGFVTSVWTSISDASSRNSRRYGSSFRRASRRRDPVRKPAYVQEDEEEKIDDGDYYKSWEPPEKKPSAMGWEELEADRNLVLQRQKFGRARTSRYSHNARKRLPLFWRFVLALFPFLRSWGGFI